MTEWELQEVLTPLWMDGGIDLAGEQLVLVAWEVMLPSWKINDPSETWLPSIDFVALDSDARLVAIELKTDIRGRKPVWSVLMQVTHRAVSMSRSASIDRIQEASRSCRGGPRIQPGSTDSAASVLELHRRHFGLDRARDHLAGGVRRVVAATSIGPSYCEIHDEYNTLDVSASLVKFQDQYEPAKDQSWREFKRMRSLGDIEDGELSGPVEFLIVNDVRR